jgi:hypothetical protein
MFVSCLALQFIALFLQTAVGVSNQSGSCLLPDEDNRLKTEIKLDNRIKIYQNASTRCQSAFQYAAAASNPGPVSRILDGWMQVLEMSLQDIEKNSDRRKKSKALIKYEIHLRKALAAMQDSKMKFSYEDMQQIDSWTGKADTIRKKFVDILFQR